MFKVFLILILTIITFSSFASSSDKVRDKAKKDLSSSQMLHKTVNEIFDGYDLLIESLKSFKSKGSMYGDVDKPEDWIKAKRKINSANPCKNYILKGMDDKNLRGKVIKLVNEYKDAIGYDRDLDRKDMKVMMNRPYRKKIQEGINNVPREEYYKLCTFDVGDDIKKKVTKNIKAKFNVPYKAPDLSIYHPRDQKIINSLIDQAKKQGLKGKKINNFAFKTFIMQMMPMLRSKIDMEILPDIKKRCPGVVEKTWSKCKGKKGYENKMAPNVPKYYCLLDNKETVDKKCFPEGIKFN